MDYEDFAIKIEPGSNGEHPVLVLSSPAGQGSGFFRIPLDQQLTPPASHEIRKRHLSLDTPQLSTDPEVVGSALFRSLFADRILDLYLRSLGALGERQGLRIRLHLDPELPGLEPVCRLPWELLYQRDQGFLGLSLASPIVRYLDVPRPPTPVPLDDPFRVLVVIALPADAPYLDVGLERVQIETAWRGVSEVDVRFLEGATRASLLQALTQGPCHALHFMGHGEIDPASGEGALLLEGPGGEADYLTGSMLAELLKSSLPALVVLNACQTAEGAYSADAFAGVAGSLVKAGILSVVAMQAPISDSAALAFSKNLFRRLAAGDPVDAAVTAGRLAIRAIPESADEWSIPVLFLRRPDGKIFDPVRVPLQERETALRLVRSLLAWQRERFLAELDPGGPSAPGAEVDVCEMAALRGGEDWLHCSETLLALRSPLRLPFDDSLKAWRPRPTLCWSSEGETLVGMGEEFELFSDPPDLAAAAPLTWQGLRFRDGSVAARLELPLLAVGGAAGLVLRWSGRVGVLGILRVKPPEGRLLAEIHERLGGRLLPLRSTPVEPAEAAGVYEFRMVVDGDQVTLRVGGAEMKTRLTAASLPGYAGLVKLEGALAYVSRLTVVVSTRDSQARRFP
ncbi:MAG TPA: CHAT domain-containing protein [Thermoanaerobaculia bacterium]|nr:CHAT domain-containing protein [Thermoanaerobaculia bacterium]